MSTRKTLKALAEARRGVLVPGAFNALSAKVIEDLGFEAIYVTGAGVTNMWFGMPDQGFMGLADIADHTARIRDAVKVPLIVDADTGFGNALNVYHAVRTLERAGADCIQLEDQVAPKRCGHFSGKEVISTEEAVGKIKAAVDARRDENHGAHRCGRHPWFRGCGGTRAALCRGWRRHPVCRSRDASRRNPRSAPAPFQAPAHEHGHRRQDAPLQRR
jgi:2-methylisocitrate lyase-like PEP mutase family enzyme